MLQSLIVSVEHLMIEEVDGLPHHRHEISRIGFVHEVQPIDLSLLVSPLMKCARCGVVFQLSVNIAIQHIDSVLDVIFISFSV